MRHRADMPDVAENLAGAGLQDRGQLAIVLPGARNRIFIDRAFGRTEMGMTFGRHVSLRAVEAHVTLALLLGVVERMRVEKRPDELAADVFEAELEVRMLIDGVMAAVIGGRTDRHALLVGDLLGTDQARRIASARGRDRGVKGM